MAHKAFIDHITRTFATHSFKGLRFIRTLAEAVAEEIDNQGNISRMIKEVNIQMKPPDQAEKAISIMQGLAELYAQQDA